MRRALHLYHYVNLLSLDIVAGAVISAVFFSRLLDVTLLPYALIALALTVWIIYTADHLRDARHIGPNATSDRHAFHHRHFIALTVVMLVAIVADGVVIIFMRERIITAGLWLSAIVGVYLLMHRYLKWAKEIIVAGLYTCGILLPSVAISPLTIALPYVILFVVFALLALINLLVLSWFDYDSDLQDGQYSFATVLSKSTTRKVIFVLIGLNFAATGCLFILAFESAVVFIMLAMNTVLLLTFLFANSTDRNNTYRLFGDGVFLLPMVYLL